MTVTERRLEGVIRDVAMLDLTPSGSYACPYHRGKQDSHYCDPVTTPFAQLWAG